MRRPYRDRSRRVPNGPTSGLGLETETILEPASDKPVL
ncbi:hypothetical protein C487_15920 [Natrinema pallidum DSM 3751]|uniref:Uncharacterized protein n=1 Tax=Natrinema pallidum DSM 3751 TaxID=1227495 RepID=L9YL17_9EURY|nr:hypothetical protein C487_15920 [Natrinema pallidum DSM 3751]